MPSVLHIGRHFFYPFLQKNVSFGFGLFLVTPKLNCTMQEFGKIAEEVTLGLNGLRATNKYPRQQ